MWIQSSSAVLNNGSVALSFTFNNEDALSFCQVENNKFDAIFSSNLLDHLSPPNLILSTLPLIKPEGLIFTTTFHWKDFANSIEEYVRKCFGFDFKLLPSILGIECIDCGGFDSVKTLVVLNSTDKCTWKKMSTEPPLISKLPSLEPGNITESLFNSVYVCLSSLGCLTSSANVDELLVLKNNNIETAILVLQTFKSLVGASASYQFWEPLASAMLQECEPFLIGFHTQAWLHKLHFHSAIINELTCPMCRHEPLEKVIGLFCAELSLPLSVPIYSSIHFMAIIHSSPTLECEIGPSEFSRKGNAVYIIDSIHGSVDGKTLKLKFFALLYFVEHDFNVTIVCCYLCDGGYASQIVVPAMKIRTMQIDFEHFNFFHVSPSAVLSPSKIMCGYCNSSGNLKTCKRCGVAQYCDRECQTKHWPMHKADCKRSAKLAASPLEIHCAFCGSTSAKLRLCTGCKKVKYCGTKCQRNHWKDHKSACKLE